MLRGSAGDLKVELASLRIHDGNDDQAVDPLVASAEAGEASAWRGSAYAVFEGLQLVDYGNRIPSLSFEVVADDAPVALGSMLGELGENIAAEAGPAVTGFAATGTSLRAVVEAIRPAFAIYCRDEERATVRFGSGRSQGPWSSRAIWEARRPALALRGSVAISRHSMRLRQRCRSPTAILRAIIRPDYSVPAARDRGFATSA